ncbi:MAG: glutamate--cysteine ligase, partial [Candidatus Hydrogenedentes bacterium]|nr:glutamate--cysteine ligase [Candidatus Hydrogenedentota bacterium]
LDGLAARFQDHVNVINEMLRPMGARLMPTAMHPWMDPHTETRLWPHEYSPIYESFNRIFECRGHGWSNLQSVHLNLPFADDAEFARLHAAIRLLMPIMPALAASSPIMERGATGLLDNRLDAYQTNCQRIPSVTGFIVPEPIFHPAEYEVEILQRMYDDIAPHDPDGILQEEWLNARGAIARFDRNTIEIRVLDIQECPKADLAIVRAVAAVLNALTENRWIDALQQEAWEVDPLYVILLETMRSGDAAVIRNRSYLHAFGLRAKAATAGELWQHLIDSVLPSGDPAREPLQFMLREGCLARRILAACNGDFSDERIASVYGELCACLAEGRMFTAT